MKSSIPLFKVFMADEAPAAVADVLHSGYIAEGPVVEAFEIALRVFLRSLRPLLAVNSCTSALDLALHLCGVGPGDEVISTAMTCTATNSGIVNRGAQIIWADVDPRTGNIDPSSVASKLTSKTKAIMAVDWGGRPCDYVALKSHGIPVIEDAAHAFGASTDGGDYVCFSFQAIKHLTTGDGGAIIVPEAQYDRARKLRWFGLDRRASADFRCAQTIEESGYKYQMNDIAAAIGLANLKHMDDVLAAHCVNASMLQERLSCDSKFEIVPCPESSSWWIYTLIVPEGRDSFVDHMKWHGVGVSEVHARNDKHPIFPDAQNEEFPGLATFSSQQISLPCGWWLNEDDVVRIAETARSWAP